MKDSEVIIQLREENERQKLSLLGLRQKVRIHDTALAIAAILVFVGMGAGRWQGRREAQEHQCSACPVPTCPVCAPVPNSCKDTVMEMKGIYGGSTAILSCPHPDQKMEPTNYGWVTCRCAPNERKPQ